MCSCLQQQRKMRSQRFPRFCTCVAFSKYQITNNKLEQIKKPCEQKLYVKKKRTQQKCFAKLIVFTDDRVLCVQFDEGMSLVGGALWPRQGHDWSQSSAAV